MAAQCRSAFSPIDDRALEWLCAGVMVTWGVTLALDGRILEQPAFSAVHRFGATETFWAWMFGSAGLARIAALYINGRWPKTPIIRMVAAGFGFLSWSQLSFLLLDGTALAGGVPATGFGVYAMLALGELYSIYRAAHDARYYHA